MRDLRKYPITLKEMAQACDRAADALAEQDPPHYGDLTVPALRAAAWRLVRLDFASQPSKEEEPRDG